MRQTGFRFLFLIGLMLTLGLTSVFAAGNDKNKKKDDTKRPKNSGALKVSTSPMVMTVKVDGQVLGLSGLKDGDDIPTYWLAPGFHNLEVIGPEGKIYKQEVEIRKNATSCVCIERVEKTETEACPYNVTLDGPKTVLEGDLITFASFNAVDTTPDPIRYVWEVTPSSAKVTSGRGTPAITIDTSNLGGQIITARLDASTGFYDEICRQKVSASTEIEKIPPPEIIKYDCFESKAFDDDKARFDSYAIQLQNNPDLQAYIVTFQGTDKNSVRNRNVDKLTKRAFDYLVNTRGIDARRIVFTNWGTRPTTEFCLYLIPPGASPPIPQ